VLLDGCWGEVLCDEGEVSPWFQPAELFSSTLSPGEVSPSPSAYLTTDLTTIGRTFFEECPFHRMMDKYGDKQAYKQSAGALISHHACVTITYRASLTLTDGNFHGKAWLQRLTPRIREPLHALPLQAGARCFRSIASPPAPLKGGAHPTKPSSEPAAQVATPHWTASYGCALGWLCQI